MKKKRNQRAGRHSALPIKETSMNVPSHFSKDEDELDTCKVCMENYADDLRPRSLSCGHSFCSNCLNKLAKHGYFLCPKCKRSHTAWTSQDFPINYDLEEMILKFRQTQLNVSQQTAPLSPSSKMQRFLEDQVNNAEDQISSTDNVLSFLSKYKDFLQETKSRHRDLLPKIYELASMNEDAITNLDSEDSKMVETQAEGIKLKGKLSATLQLFKSKQQSLTVIEDLDRNVTALENWSEICNQTLTKTAITRDSDKLLKASTAALETFNIEKDKEESNLSDPFDSSQLSPEKEDTINGCYNFSIENLLEMSQLTKSLVEGGQVFAYKEHKGRIWRAPVSLHGDNINLHYLRDEEPPSSSYIIKYTELIGALIPESVTAFLDLAWNGSVQGRVHILLNCATPLARHFQALCTGDLGPSYAQCKFLEVAYKNDSTNQALRSGDYESNNGSGGAALFPGLNMNDDQYKYPLVPGIVWATYDTDDGPQSSQFTITTGGYSGNSYHYQRVFGIVEGGLDVVKAAAMVDDITSVQIVNCGVVILSKGLSS